MGHADCRFKHKTGCKETGSLEYNILLTGQDLIINLPGMWKHYMVEHLIQPSEYERRIIMDADPKNVSTSIAMTISRGNLQNKVMMLYVETTREGYTHKIGEKADLDFIDKVELLLSKTCNGQERDGNDYKDPF